MASGPGLGEAGFREQLEYSRCIADRKRHRVRDVADLETSPITSGGKKPPSPPAAPTTPVTEPTHSGATNRATSANTAPDPAPSAAAIPR